MASSPSALNIEYDRIGRGTRLLLSARVDGRLIHRNTVDLNNATAREHFAAAVSERLPAYTAEQIQEMLLGLSDEVQQQAAQPPVGGDYQVVDDAVEPEQCGLYVVRGERRQLTNFRMTIDRDYFVEDDLQPTRRFEGRIELLGHESQFSINAEDYGNDAKLRSSIFEAAGPQAKIFCRVDELRIAISSVSNPVERRVTTNFGWVDGATAYRFPSGQITASGYESATDDDPVRVDLSGEERARHLDLQAPSDVVPATKQHIICDLMQLHCRPVMFAIMAAVSLAVLYRFVPAMGRFVLWLTGLTGSGKSFAAKLAQNFFGDFPLETGRFVTWASTGSYTQRQGYFFRDAMYLVDDYKPEVIARWEVVKILQAYGNATSRGRLNSDSTTKLSREIRGLLVSTGEDIPEHTASSVARSIVITVPQTAKDLQRGSRCVQMRRHYSAVMADYIHWLIIHGRPAGFAERVRQLQQSYYADIAGQQNDARIASNFAMLAAAFEEFAYYMRDVWPEACEAARQFVEADLIGIRNEMLGIVREQQASEVFLATLWTLIQHGQVRIKNWYPDGRLADATETKPLVGRSVAAAAPRDRLQPTERCERGEAIFEIATSMAMEAVQGSLRRQGKPDLPVTERTLLDQLAQAGVLLDAQNQPLPPEGGGNRTRVQRLEGGRRHNVFRISFQALAGEVGPMEEADGGGGVGQ